MVNLNLFLQQKEEVSSKDKDLQRVDKEGEDKIKSYKIYN